MGSLNLDETNRILARIATLLEERQLVEESFPENKLEDAVYIWEPEVEPQQLRATAMDNVLFQDDLLGIDEQKHILYGNTQQFIHGHLANNALLWGARGTGKSSLVKAVVHELQCTKQGKNLVLIEIHRQDLQTLSQLLDILRCHPKKRILIFCDDLSFDGNDEDYKSLKSVLEGGVEGRPPHVLFYATSNRRHLLPRMMIDNEERSLIHGGEALEEKISLSDRFGLWLGFHAMDQTTYLAIVKGYLDRMEIKPAEDWQEAAKQWARQRGQMSGRVAYQCVCDIAGKYAMEQE